MTAIKLCGKGAHIDSTHWSFMISNTFGMIPPRQVTSRETREKKNVFAAQFRCCTGCLQIEVNETYSWEMSIWNPAQFIFPMVSWCSVTSVCFGTDVTQKIWPVADRSWCCVECSFEAGLNLWCFGRHLWLLVVVHAELPFSCLWVVKVPRPLWVRPADTPEIIAVSVHNSICQV